MDLPPARPLRIVHVFRAPIGGLFRHVLDLSRGQAEAGHAVGVVCDVGGGERADAALAALSPVLELGVRRMPMSRAPGPSDIAGLLHFSALLRKAGPDVVHGHGAKGGLMARALPSLGFKAPYVTAYTPHGGSLNFGPEKPGHTLYMAVERFLRRGTGVFTFESQFAQDRFETLVGPPRALVRVIRNGAHLSEFEPVVANADAADLVFLGEFRVAKGLLVLLDALALLRDRRGRETSVALVGGGPEEPTVRARVAELGLTAVSIRPAMAAREALALGRIFVLPSLFESLPYVLIEAAAGGMDIVATRVGGVAEGLGPAADLLVPPGDPVALADRIARVLDEDPAMVAARRAAVRDHVRAALTVPAMVSGVLRAYEEALAARA